VSSTEEARTLAGADGRFRLSLPGPGAWTLGASHDGNGSEPVQVRGDARSPIELLIEDRTELHLWAEGPGGLGSGGARVHSARRAPGTGRLQLVSQSPDASGRVTLRGRPGEAVWVFATHPSFAPSEIRRLEFPAEDASNQVLHLSSGARIVIVVPVEPDSPGPPQWDLQDAELGLSLTPYLPPPAIERFDGGVTMQLERVPATRLVVLVNGSRHPVSLAEGQFLEVGSGSPRP
jgi:hypothetical protein